MCTLLTANAPPTIGHLYRFATRDDVENAFTRRGLAEALDKAALMRESALKSCIFVGVPRVSVSVLVGPPFVRVRESGARSTPSFSGGRGIWPSLPLWLIWAAQTNAHTDHSPSFQTILSLANLHETIEDDVRNGLRKTSVRYVYLEGRVTYSRVLARPPLHNASTVEGRSNRCNLLLGRSTPRTSTRS